MKLATKLTLIFLLLSITPVMIAGYTSYRHCQQVIKEDALDYLISTNITKSDQFSGWMRTNQIALQEVASYPYMIECLTVMASYDQTQPEYIDSHKSIVDELFAPAIHGVGFKDLCVLRPSDGLILASSNESYEGKYEADQPFFTEGKERIYIQNMCSFPSSSESPAIVIAMPIKNNEGNTAAVLAGRIDMSQLSGILMKASNLRQTQDTYLINKSDLFVTTPKFGEGHGLKKAIRSDGEMTELTSQRDIFGSYGLYKNYRGTAVIGAYQWLPEWDLYIQTEIDQAEAFDPISNLRNIMLAGGGGIAVIGIMLARFFGRTITGPMRRLSDGALEIGRGNLDHKVGTKARDEVGDLSRAFDRMTQNLKGVTVSRDDLAEEVAERKRVEEALRESEERYRMLLATMNEGLAQIDSDGIVLFVNDKTCQLAGCSRDELVGHSFMELLGKEGADIVERQLAAMRNKTIHYTYEMDARARDGEKRHVLISTRNLFNEHGDFMGGVSIITDISEIKQVQDQLKHYAAELEKTNAEITRYANSVAHDLRQPLQTISFSATLLGKRLADRPLNDSRSHLDRIDRACRQANALIERLLEFATIGKNRASRETVQVGVFLRQLIDVMGLLPSTVIVMPCDWPEIQVEQDLLRQVFQNLLGNAAKYNLSSQKRIELGWRTLGKDNYEFFVKDNGIGISPEDQERIFRPFVRASASTEQHMGTGLGLAIAGRAVEELGGILRVESEPGKGSTFYFTIQWIGKGDKKR